MKFHIAAREVQGVTVLDLSGGLVLGEDCDRLVKEVKQLLKANKKHILLNLGKVDRLDSSGLGALAEVQFSMRKRGGQLRLVNVTERIRQLLSVTKLASYFEIAGSEEEAVASFKKLSTALPIEAGPSGAAERRRTQRARLMIQVESLSNLGSSLGQTEDISEGGLLMRARDTFARDTEVTVRFHLPPIPPGRLIESPGVVVRVQPGIQMGIRFSGLRDNDRQAITRFVEGAGTAGNQEQENI